MQYRKQRKVIFLTGMTGSGKSRFLKQYILPFIPRSIIIDPMDEYEGTRFQSFTDLKSYVLEMPDISSFRLVCGSFTSEEIESVFELVWRIGNLTLVCEESERYIEGDDSSFYFNELSRRGRHKDISIVALSQRVPDLHPDFRASINTFITFRQMEAVDLRHLEERGFEREDVEQLTLFDSRFSNPVYGTHYLLKGESLAETLQFYQTNL